MAKEDFISGCAKWSKILKHDSKHLLGFLVSFVENNLPRSEDQWNKTLKAQNRGNSSN
jgi:hypothetical protein